MLGIPVDKLLHFGVGVSISFGGAGAKHPKSGLALSAIAGVAKEVHDQQENVKAQRAGERRPHDVELADIGATVLGGTAGFGLGYLAFGSPEPRVNVPTYNPFATLEEERRRSLLTEPPVPAALPKAPEAPAAPVVAAVGAGAGMR
jgi:hypothetical protein